MLADPVAAVQSFGPSLGAVIVCVSVFIWSQMDVGPRPSREHSLDRKNVDGHYELGNCRWATRREQYLNRRTIPISRQDLQQWLGDSEGLRIWSIVSNKVKNKGSMVFV